MVGYEVKQSYYKKRTWLVYENLYIPGYGYKWDQFPKEFTSLKEAKTYIDKKKNPCKYCDHICEGYVCDHYRLRTF